MIDWDNVEEYVAACKGIAFDTCHKIYVLMDDAQIAKTREYEYDPLYTTAEMSADEMLATLKHWYAESCGLKFIEAVATVDGDPNDGFTTLIEQGARETDECYECGEESCEGECIYEERCERCGDDDVYEDYLCRDCWDDNQEEENE